MDLEELDAQGWTVVRGAVGEDLLGPLRALPEQFPGNPQPPVWGHQALWDVRQAPAVHAEFAAALGQDELWVSQDALGVSVPGWPGLPIHWDIDPRQEWPHRMLQGVLYVTDVGPGQAPFTVVPELWGHTDEWFAAHPDAESTWGIDIGDAEVLEVLGQAGDLIIFDGLLAHGRADNTTDRTRIAQYLTMWTPGSWGEPDAESHQEIWRSGMANPGFRNKPGWDQPQPWPPAELTPLGRSLIGL